MASDSRKGDAPFGDQATREAFGCAEHFGRFGHRKESL
jgi:hypothetical protein